MTKQAFHSNNLILIGMPGCGKSTLGVLLAKVLRLSFLDTDLLIQMREGRRLQEIIDRDGLDDFRRIEKDVLSGRSVTDTLIATGGSAIYYPDAMTHLRSIGRVVYLRSPLEAVKQHLADFSNRGIAMPRGMTIDELYRERAPLYERYADVAVEVSAEQITENMERVLAAIGTDGKPLSS